MNAAKLKGRIRAEDMTQEELAQKIGISLGAFSSKINGKSEFTLDEANRICKVLKIDDVVDKVEIFLA